MSEPIRHEGAAMLAPSETFELRRTEVRRRRLYIAAIGVHDNGYQHWLNETIGYRVVNRRNGQDVVRWKGHLYRVYQEAPYPENRIDVPCQCSWGQRRGEKK